MGLHEVPALASRNGPEPFRRPEMGRLFFSYFTSILQCFLGWFCRDKKIKICEIELVSMTYVVNEWKHWAVEDEFFAPFISPFLIICMTSMSSKRMQTQRKFLNPSAGRVRR